MGISGEFRETAPLARASFPTRDSGGASMRPPQGRTATQRFPRLHKVPAVSWPRSARCSKTNTSSLPPAVAAAAGHESEFRQTVGRIFNPSPERAPGTRRIPLARRRQQRSEMTVTPPRRKTWLRRCGEMGRRRIAAGPPYTPVILSLSKDLSLPRAAAAWWTVPQSDRKSVPRFRTAPSTTSAEPAPSYPISPDPLGICCC